MSTKINNKVNQEVRFCELNRGEMFLGNSASPGSAAAVHNPKTTLFIRISKVRKPGEVGAVNAIRIQDGAQFEFLDTETVIPVDAEITVTTKG